MIVPGTLTATLDAPVVEQVAQRLTEGQGTSKQTLTIPTRLTEANRSTSRDGVRVKLEALQPAGEDPAHSETANQWRGNKVAQRQREFRQWDAEHGGEADPEVFRREILPGLQDVSLGAMARAMGLSKGYCSFIRRGLKVPHQRHWESLRAIHSD